MKAIHLNGFEGPNNLSAVDVDTPRPSRGQVLMQVKAAGINFAELEMTWGRYPTPRPLPLVMGFEAAGIVIETGEAVENLKVGDRIAAIVASGGYAEYAIADASIAIPIPNGTSFAEASAIPIQATSAYTLLKFAAKPKPDETVLIQAAAGGVGTFLVQLAKAMGVKSVIALASSKAKLDLVRKLGADVAIDYSEPGWADQVRVVTAGKGVDVVLESVSGDVGDESFKLLAPFGRLVMYGAKNAYDNLPTEKVKQLIHQNQSIIGFNLPSLRPESIRQCIPELLKLIATGSVKLLAPNTFPLSEVRKAFKAIASRQTMGKVVLVP